MAGRSPYQSHAKKLQLGGASAKPLHRRTYFMSKSFFSVLLLLFYVAISEPLTHRDPQSTIVKFPIIALVKMTKSCHLFPILQPMELVI